MSRIDNIHVWVLCQEFGCTITDLRKTRGGREVEQIKQAFAWTLRHIAQWPLLKIARLFKKNHSTIVKNLKTFDNSRTTDHRLKIWFENILRNVIELFVED